MPIPALRSTEVWPGTPGGLTNRTTSVGRQRPDIAQATHVSYVPRALRADARLHVRARAERVLLEGRRAIGVVAKYVDASGRSTGQRLLVLADRSVVSAGALHTPVLLKRSDKLEVPELLNKNHQPTTGGDYRARARKMVSVTCP
jgi:choline dehydrogenase-like flavoprotein